MSSSVDDIDNCVSTGMLLDGIFNIFLVFIHQCEIQECLLWTFLL
jgi:hypothetical protein